MRIHFEVLGYELATIYVDIYAAGELESQQKTPVLDRMVQGISNFWMEHMKTNRSKKK